MFLADKATSMPQPSFVILATLPKMKTKKLKHQSQEVRSPHAKHPETASFETGIYSL